MDVAIMKQHTVRIEAKDQKPTDTVFFSLLWFPLVQFGLFAFLTYVDLPVYAYYPIAVGAPFAVLFLFKKMIENMTDVQKEQKQMRTFLPVLSGLTFCMALAQAVTPSSAGYLPITAAVKSFMRDNAGVYAMGKGAGITSYVTETPFVRTDGLAMDSKMTDSVGQVRDLTTTLKEYGVRYYVGINALKARNCYVAREPAETSLGPTNKAMSSWLCSEPVFEKRIYPKTTLFIFDLNSEKTSPEKTDAPKGTDG